MEDPCMNQDVLDGIAFVGNTLGPMFLYDPKFNAEHVAPVLQAFAELDAGAAAEDWPFVEAYTAAAFISQMQKGLAEGIDAEPLYSEYRRLFVGPATKVAPPWGSVYTDKEQVIFGDTTIALRRWMKREGLALNRGDSEEPEDHIGSMLVLMAYIASHRPEILREYLSEHLLTWAGHFMVVVQKESQHPFYEGLARLTGATLAGMQKELDLHVDVPNFYR
ncbi:MAG: Tat proofreading chaperone DmsD [Eggerthellales bacterium]|nr:Tat proofreading chaperone DmsD [Eggerthellales bacterium]